MERVPHVMERRVSQSGLVEYPIFCDQHQLDGQASVLMTWARLALRRGHTVFEDWTYPLVAKLMDRTVDRPFFMFGGWPTEPGLIRNLCLEHSRESRYWDVFDILTQCHVGAALEAMAIVAERRGDVKHVRRWQERMVILKRGVASNLVRQVEGKTVYLEMRLPDSPGGVPYLGMGWLNLSPIATQWEPLDRQVLRNTVNLLRKVALQEMPGGLKWLPDDWNADGTYTKEVIGKRIGWEIEYCRQEKEYSRIIEWLDFLESVNKQPLYLESAKLGNNGQWTVRDAGNGEQASWWCWAMARLRKEVGLPAVAERPAKGQNRGSQQ